jgi:hypothetical protein
VRKVPDVPNNAISSSERQNTNEDLTRIAENKQLPTQHKVSPKTPSATRQQTKGQDVTSNVDLAKLKTDADPNKPIKSDSLNLTVPCPTTSPDFLEKVTCLPKECRTTKHFISSPAQLADKRGFVFLASYPGSGNTWTRAIIEQGTRIWTGSVFNDLQLKKDGFFGESRNNAQDAFPTVSVIKTHYPLLLPKLYAKTSAVVQILRSPYDTLMADFQLQMAVRRNKAIDLSHNKTANEISDPHVAGATLEEFQTKFPNWFRIREAKWKNYAHFWLGRKNVWNHSDTMKCEKNGVTSFVINSNPDFIQANRSIPILVLFYEDFVHNLGETSLRMFSFLKQKLGNAMPSIDTSVLCALQDQKHATKEQRKHDIVYNPYKDPNGKLANNTLFAEKFCALVEGYWYNEKWGDCKSALLQIERPQPSIAKKQQQQLDKFPLPNC